MAKHRTTMTPILQRTVREIMISKPVCTTPDVSLLEAASVMKKASTSCLLVDLGDPAKGYGILTAKDTISVLHAGVEDAREAMAGVKVADVMTAPIAVIPSYYLVSTCLDLMRMLGVRRAPVVDNAELVGIVSLTDIFEGHSI